MIDPLFPNNRDIILNNLNTIEGIRAKTQNSLKGLLLSKKLCTKNLLDKKSRGIIFHSPNKSPIKLYWRGNKYFPTPREYDCLQVLSRGASNQFIADYLKISVDTVKFHLNNVKSKIGVISRNDLIEVALALPKSTNFKDNYYEK